MTIKKLEVFVIVSIIAVIGIIYAFTQKPVYPSNTNLETTQDQNNDSLPSTNTSVRPGDGDDIQSVQLVPTTTIEYKGQDGKNALELLLASHQVEYKHYDFGDMVTTIDGITPDSSHFWALYVNDQFSQVGASAYITKSTDTLRWQIDAVVDTTK